MEAVAYFSIFALSAGEVVAQGLRDILVFEVAGQRFGLAGAAVRQLLRVVLISPLPRSPRFVEGVINLRGAIVPVLDIRHWLGLPAKAVELSDHLIVAWANERLVALRVDRALELVHLDGTAPQDGDSIAGKDVQVLRRPDGLLLLPDLERFLAQEAASLAEALRGAATGGAS